MDTLRHKSKQCTFYRKGRAFVVYFQISTDADVKIILLWVSVGNIKVIPFSLVQRRNKNRYWIWCEIPKKFLKKGENRRIIFGCVKKVGETKNINKTNTLIVSKEHEYYNLIL